MNDVELENKSKRNLKNEFFNFLKDLIIIVVVVLVIRNFFILPFQISWQSMYANYYDKEFIIVDRFSYLVFKKPQRWDVIVFKTYIDDKEYFIKRIIWLPWETLKIASWSVFIKTILNNNFIELDEKYLMDVNYKSTYVKWTDKEFIFKIPENHYFVMWDNRLASTDSRNCFLSCDFWNRSNYINKKDIIWKVFIDLWYFNIKTLSFTQPDLWIDSRPKWFNSLSSYKY